MCGISGFVTNKIINEDEFIETIKSMNGSLSHRGPDHTSYWMDYRKGICIGHNRLSIQDLSSAGNQPMISDDKRFVLSFNGEIYNHYELRRKIENLNIENLRWKSSSDTETLLKCIQTFGFEKSLNFIIGMFSIFLFDRKKDKIYLAIDRFGEKPLYFGNVNNSLVLGSELKALKHFKNFSNSIDINNLDDFMRYSCLRAPKSIFKNIFKLEQGSMIEISINDILGKKIEDNYFLNKKFYKFWWNPKDELIKNSNKKFKSFEIAKNSLSNALSNSVSSQLISDVPIGSFLSGGIDSSLITSLMSKLSKNKVKTFTIGFSENKFDESKYAKQVSKVLGTEHYEAVLSPKETLSIIPNLMNIYDEPFADSSQIPTILLSKFSSKKVKVALSGDGGDELFGGYNRYFWVNRIWKYFYWLPFDVRKLIGYFFSYIPPGQINLFYNLILFNKNKIKDNFIGEKAIKTFQRLKYVRSIEDLFISLTTEWSLNEKPVNSSTNHKINLRYDFDQLKKYDFKDQMMFWDIKNYLPNDILCKVDRASMSASLETRAPFLDKNVYNISTRIPIEMKINKNKGKIILRDMLKTYLPSNLIERPKQGFGIPLSSWLKGDLKEWVEELLEPSKIKKQGYLNYKIVEKCWNDHKKNRFDNHNKLWPIIMFQSWLSNN